MPDDPTHPAARSGHRQARFLLPILPHFEVASFRSLSTAAETIGDSQIKDFCDRSVDEKKELAARL